MTTAINPKEASIRILVLGGFFGLLFLAVAVRSFQLQVLDRADLFQKAKNQIVRNCKTVAKRGVVYDAKRRELAVSLDIDSVFANPVLIPDKKDAAEKLGKSLDIPKEDILNKFDTKKTFVWITRQATPQQVRQIKTLGLKGVDFLPASSRFYPNKSLGAQVIGFCGLDGKGMEGIEYSCNDVLYGPEARWTAMTDALGKSFRSEQPEEVSEAGQNVVLTLDRTVQYIAEEAIEEAVTSHKAKSGIAVVMVPSTGAVLAMANYPFMNPNAYGEYEPFSWKNRAVTDQYEPGSTMKVLMASAALEAGVKYDQVFFCENGSFRVGGHVVHDVHPRGSLALWEIVKYSSNIGAAKVGLLIGAKNLYTTLKAFNIGDKTGIESPGETPGVLPPYQSWSRIGSSTIAFGQGVTVTAIQMAAAISAIANGGVYMKPYLVQAVVDSDGKVIKSFQPQEKVRVMSERNAELVKKMMLSVMDEGGTGTLAVIKGYSAGGKTGTAQKVSGGGYAKGKYVSSFVGFTPFEHPELAIVVLVDEPTGCHYGGVVSGPAFEKIGRKTLQYLNVPPEFGEDQLMAYLQKTKKAS